jgi:hypothetical protein
MVMVSGTPSGAAAQEPAISGVLHYYSNQEPVAEVSVQLLGAPPGGTVTDADGAYAFDDPGPGNWQIAPVKTGDTRGAISALDASHVLQSVVGIREFTMAQQVACDVTGDGSVSSLDAARILQFVAGIRTRFPVAETCGSDWAFIPDAAIVPNQHLFDPQMVPSCNLGAIAYEPLVPPADAQSFIALLFGDCTGNWQAPTPIPTETSIPPATETPTATETPPDTETPIDTPPPSSTPTSTGSATASGTVTRTGTRTWTYTRTLTPSSTATFTRTATLTWTASRTGTETLTPSMTATQTGTRTGTATWTSTSTRTGSRTQTPTPTYTPSLTPTSPCPNGLEWQLSPAQLISAQTGGTLWLTKTVPTSTGWGIFWLREPPGDTQDAHLFYAHINFSGQLTAGPMEIATIPRLVFRGRYYMAAWNQDHYAILLADRSTLIYQNMTLDGTLTGRKTVGPPLFIDPAFDQEADGDLDPHPNGFVGVIEGECVGHSCAYAFKLDLNGNQIGPNTNLVDFDFTHQFYPRSAFDGVGFAIISVKDIEIANGGVMTKYFPLNSGISTHSKVVPAKQYLWDEFPDIAWNGDHFAAIWTENSARSHQLPWQIHFASFRRTKTVSTLIGERIIDVVAQKTNHRWTTQVHASGADWIAQYASRAADNSVVAVYELLGDNADTRAVIEPFVMNVDALGSSPHPGLGGTLGIARGNLVSGGTEVTFHTLAPPVCQ